MNHNLANEYSLLGRQFNLADPNMSELWWIYCRSIEIAEALHDQLGERTSVWKIDEIATDEDFGQLLSLFATLQHIASSTILAILKSSDIRGVYKAWLQARFNVLVTLADEPPERRPPTRPEASLEWVSKYARETSEALRREGNLNQLDTLPQWQALIQLYEHLKIASENIERLLLKLKYTVDKNMLYQYWSAAIKRQQAA